MIAEQLQQMPLVQALGDAVVAGSMERGEISLEIEPRRIGEVCRKLKTEKGFERLSAVTCVDWYPMEPRFVVVYQLHSIQNNLRIRLKCSLGGESPAIDSVCEVWRSADWYEREIFDLFGVKFLGHPDLRRILMPDDWEGHPLRKDFPIHGHKYSYPQE